MDGLVGWWAGGPMAGQELTQSCQLYSLSTAQKANLR